MDLARTADVEASAASDVLDPPRSNPSLFSLFFCSLSPSRVKLGVGPEGWPSGSFLWMRASFWLADIACVEGRGEVEIQIGVTGTIQVQTGG